MKNLRKLRLSKNLSQAELAEKFNISPSAIGMYERGCREASNELTKAIADYFGVTIDYLLGRNVGVLQDGVDNGLKNLDRRINKANEAYAIVSQLPPEMQEAALAQLRALANLNK